MVRDIVCGMQMNESVSVKSVHNGRIYYFCSFSCKNIFDKDSKQFVR